MSTYRVKRKLYVAPALLSAGKAVMTAANIGGTAMTAKDMISGDKEETSSYNPQNTTLSNNLQHPKQFSIAAFGKGAMDIAKGVGKGVWKFTKDNKKSLAGWTAATTAMTAGVNKLSQPSDPNKESKPSSNASIANKTALAGISAAGYGAYKAGKTSKELAKEADKLTNINKTVTSSGIKNVTGVKQRSKQAADLMNKSKSVSKLKSAGKYGLIAAGLTSAGLLAKKKLIDEPNQKQYASAAMIGMMRGMVNAGKHGSKFAASLGGKTKSSSVMKELGKNAFNSIKSGNWSKAGRELGNAAGIAGKKALDAGIDMASFGKANSAYKSITKSLKDQGGTAKKVGDFLGKNQTLGKATIGATTAGAIYGATDKIGEKIGNKIVKPTEEND